MKQLGTLFGFLSLLFLSGALLLFLFPNRPAEPPAALPPLTGTIERIEINKSARTLQVYQNGVVVRTWPIGLGSNPVGDKHREGDGRTPEGHFKIDRRNANSLFHLSLGIDYPHPEHRARAAILGVSPGGDIFIHGQPNALPAGQVIAGDWTDGCIALTDHQIAELFAVTPHGTPVTILP